MRWYIAGLKKFTTFTGRAQREEFWYFVLFWWLTYLGLIVLDKFLIRATVSLLPDIFFLGALLPMAAVTVRRLHDTNRSGWWFACVLIPVAGWLVLLLFTVQDSVPGDAPPKSPRQKWIVIAAVCAFVAPIVGVVTLVILPVYRDMEAREKIRGSFNELDAFKPQLAAMAKRKDPSETLATAGISLAAAKGFTSLYYDPRALVLVGNLAAPFAGKSLGLQYVDTGAGPAEWKCGSTNLARHILPGPCRDEMGYLGQAEALALQKALAERGK